MDGERRSSVPSPQGDEPAVVIPDERWDMTPVWAFLWVLFAFKIATVVAIFWASQTSEAAALLTATTWPWLILPAFFLIAPLTYHYRVRRVRARRAALQRAEWMLD